MSDTFTGADFAAAAGDTSTTPATAEPSSPADTTPPGAATTAPVVDAANPVPDGTKQGPIPFDVHTRSMENARTKARDEALAEWRQQFGWAEKIDRESFEQAQQIGQLYRQNLPGFVERLIQDAMTHPTDGPQVLSMLGRALASRRGQTQAEAEPEPDLVAENGVAVYSAPQLHKWRAWHDRQLEAKLDERLQPLQQFHQQTTSERQVTQMQTQAQQEASVLLSELRQSPGFKDHEKEIKAALIADPKLSIEAAYRRIVVPKLSQSERAAVVTDLKTIAHASTPSPSNTTSSQPPKAKADMDWKELLAHEYDKRVAAGVK